MRSKRYTIVIADRSSGVVRRLTLSLRPTLVAVTGVFVLPILIGLGARWSAKAAIDELRANTARLEVENASYRAATGELTGEIGALQTVITDLGARAALDASAKNAIDRLPAVVKARAVGGGSGVTGASLLFPSPEDTFGVLRDVLQGLQSRLRIVSRDVERREALAAATPSIWPAHGWLSASYGNRSDPFTGEAESHAGIDISTDKGKPVYATADGTVESARYTGNYGNLIVIDHDFGLTTRYGHLSAFTVKAGDRVKRGDRIGAVGATGRATGSHLHYEILANGELLNPLRLLTQTPSQ